MMRSFLSILALLFAAFSSHTFAFSTLRTPTAGPQTNRHNFRADVRTTGDSSRPYSMSTTVAPSRQDVETERRRQQGDNGDSLGDMEENIEDAIRSQGPLEWLEDAMESREMDDPYHILLLGQTFEKPKITVQYVAGALEYVLDMPLDMAKELSQFSHEHGMSCLGTWSREECLSLGRQLQIRDIVCRIVPYCEGGNRGWQAKDADFSNMKDAST